MELFLWILIALVVCSLLYIWAWKPIFSGEFRELMGVKKENSQNEGSSNEESLIVGSFGTPLIVVKSPPKKRATRKTFHVVPAEKGWEVKKAGVKAPLETHSLKKDAIKAGKVLAKQEKKGQLIVHKRNGVIQTEYTYGDDPKKTKG